MDSFHAERMIVDAPRSVLAALPHTINHQTTAVLVIGGGVAGLTAALHAAEHVDVTLLSHDPLLKVNSAHAQGGIAIVLDMNDSPLLHIEDTLTAGAGLSDMAAVQTLVHESPLLMHELSRLGMPFDHKGDHIVLGLEGGHSQRRILHVGDKTGEALMQTLIRRAMTCPRLRILEGYQVLDLLDAEGICTGVLARDSSGNYHAFGADATILATGGAGALYGITSNQPYALGEGIALAYRIGAEVADMEFVQFHPTVMRTRSGRGFLVSEAARGEGGRLLTPAGYRFMPDYDPRAELAPRDVVTRSIFQAMQEHGTDHILLDLTHLSATYLRQRFPTIYARCLDEGIDPTTTPIPVAPAAHYLMGGIRTDLNQATTVPGLFAAGECACTGIHGANRLASNSLLECLVFGRRAGLAAVDETVSPAVAQLVSQLVDQSFHRTGTSPLDARTRQWNEGATKRRGNSHPHRLDDLALIIRTYAGPQRSGTGLATALAALDSFALQCAEDDPGSVTLANAALVTRLIVTGALLREESRGAHFRTDFPASDDSWRRHLIQQRGEPATLVETVAAEQPGYTLGGRAPVPAQPSFSAR